MALFSVFPAKNISSKSSGFISCVLIANPFSFVKPLLVTKTVDDFVLFKPENGLQCWDAPLPCSQFLTYEKIKLRDPERGICGGFVKIK